MTDKDSQTDSQEQQPEKEFSQEQYDMLLRCSKNKDMTEWNQWRKENPTVQIILKGARLERAYLEGAALGEAHLQNAVLWEVNLRGANLIKANLQGANPVKANLQGAILVEANLQSTNLSESNLEGAQLLNAHLEGVILKEANLPGAYLEGAPLQQAYLEGANLQGANLKGANLQNAVLWEANLRGANLREAYLQSAKFMRANLQGVEFGGAKLQGADFSRAIVDGYTLIWRCEIDRKTKFEGVGLGNIRIYPETKQLLEYNIRRMNWQKWYRGQSEKKWIIWGRQLLTSPVRALWWFSNYGLSTIRIILSFLVLSIVFATVYFICGAVDYYYLNIEEQPGIVSNLFVPMAVENEISDVYYGTMIYLRSVYFSIVTMTTLGFGDMYANVTKCGLRWWLGHFLLIVQVMLGYVLLGALVTRFAVLFTAGGPAGKFFRKR